MIYEGDVVASWLVGGATYLDMANEANSDADLLMEGIAPKHYKVIVYAVEPQVDKDGDPLIESGRVTLWKGKAVVVWSQSLPQSSNADAVEADSQQSQQSLQSVQY